MHRAHLVVGGYPPGSTAGHDMDFARRILLERLAEVPDLTTTVASDFSGLDKWLPGTDFLLTYVAGPYPDEAQDATLRGWISEGGRWLGLHGTSGGRAARIEGTRQRQMVKLPHHDSLGCFFLNHPPIRRFEVNVEDASHPITAGLGASFEVVDELYLVEILGDCNVLLTTELPKDPSPEGFGFSYDEDTSLQADGRTRVLGYTRALGSGEVAYIALGHCHSPTTNSQPMVDESVERDGASPPVFRGVWEHESYQQLLGNAIQWGLG